MIEEGSEWDIHVKTRSHRRLEAKNLHLRPDEQAIISDASGSDSG